jgi:hypothetical protein
MLVLAMTSSLSHLIPAIILQQFQDVRYLHFHRLETQGSDVNWHTPDFSALFIRNDMSTMAEMAPMTALSGFAFRSPDNQTAMILATGH